MNLKFFNLVIGIELLTFGIIILILGEGSTLTEIVGWSWALLGFFSIYIYHWSLIKTFNRLYEFCESKGGKA